MDAAMRGRHRLSCALADHPVDHQQSTMAPMTDAIQPAGCSGRYQCRATPSTMVMIQPMLSSPGLSARNESDDEADNQSPDE